ncbi:tRNA pseudouridine(55) synthase TruB [Deferribacterales bacterium RsTz2092]|nr:tRNA pseudouridine synthase B [Deferribacterales bacterium]
MNGIVNVYKESGETSFDVVARLRGILKEKSVGHTGTLDPMAEGVLVVCVGYATRFADILGADSKQYRAEFRLGADFDTYDTTGRVLATSDKQPERSEVEHILKSFVGEREFIVPSYSAKKINGERAYKLAREGTIKDAGKAIMRIDRLELTSYDEPNGEFVIECGKGTYVRSVIRELGILSGAYAAMSGLIRTRNGDFKVENSLKLAQIAELVAAGRVNEAVKPVQDVVLLPKYVVNSGAAVRIKNGVSPKLEEYLSMSDENVGGYCLLMNEAEQLLALGRLCGDGVHSGQVPVKLEKVFNE